MSEPQIVLIGRPSFDVDAFCEMLSSWNLAWKRTANATEPEELVEAAGRICYLSFGKKQSPRANSEYTRHLIAQGHESVLEHVSWTFAVARVSRAFSHQLVRHRIGFAFSQLSQQYHDEGNAEFVEPTALLEHPEELRLWHEINESALTAYKSLITALSSKGGLNKENIRAVRSSARSLLPNATETKLIFTANARALRHFLKVRGAIIGDLEMRLFSAALLKLLKAEAPSLFTDFSTSSTEDGFPLVIQNVMPQDSGELRPPSS